MPAAGPDGPEARAAEALGPDTGEADVLAAGRTGGRSRGGRRPRRCAPGREEGRAAGSDSAAPPPGSTSSRDAVEPPASGAVAVSMFDRVEVPVEGSPRGTARRRYGSSSARARGASCTAGRTTLVFGVGNPDADLMFVGEAPGRDEDREGIPVRGPGRPTAHADHRGHRPAARGRLHRERDQVPPARTIGTRSRTRCRRASRTCSPR